MMTSAKRETSSIFSTDDRGWKAATTKIPHCYLVVTSRSRIPFYLAEIAPRFLPSSEQRPPTDHRDH
jgi:hypothetical protein